MTEEDQHDDDSLHDKKRRRIALACNACRTRKSKCDGARPKCTSCTRLGFDCVYAHSATSANVIVGKEYLVGLEDRLVAVEELVKSLAQGANGQHQTSPYHGFGPAANPPVSQQHVSPGRGADADRAIVLAAEGETGYFGPSSNIALVRQVTKAVAERSWDGDTATQLNSLAFGPLDDGRPMPDTRPLDTRSNDQVPIDAFELPPFETLQARVYHYFQWTGILYPFIHPESFMATLATVRNSVSDVRRTWLGILNLMQALAHNIPVSNDVEGGELYYRRAQMLCDQQTLESINLEVVQYLLILGQYLQGSQQTMKAWTTHGVAIKAAMQLGLHSSEASKNLPQVDQEVRKRVWFICVLLDRNLSMTFGRPPAIPDHYVRLPPARPFSTLPDKAERDSVEFFNQTTTLNSIMWKIIERLYDGNLGCGEVVSLAETVSHALRIDQELVEWECSLPSDMTLVLPVHLANGVVPSRFQTILTLRRHSVHLLIYRPLLTRLLSWDGHRVPDASTSTLLSRASPNAAESTARSATECIEIVHTLLLSGDKAKRTLLGAWWYTLYYTFNAALTLLTIYLISNTPATQPYISGRLDLADIDQSIEKSISALGQVNPGSSITGKCELFLGRLLKSVRAINELTQETTAAGTSTNQPAPLQLGTGVLAPSGVATPAATAGDMNWENFLLDPGQLDDFVFGM